jgi:hypothetical protein
MTDVEWRLHEQEQSKLELPTEVTGGVVKHTNPELTTIAVYRGWLGDGAFFTSVTTRSRKHSSLRAEVGRREGYGDPPDWTERVTSVVAGLGPREVAILTLRRHADPDLSAVVERIVGSFTLLR